MAKRSSACFVLVLERTFIWQHLYCLGFLCISDLLESEFPFAMLLKWCFNSNVENPLPLLFAPAAFSWGCYHSLAVLGCRCSTALFPASHLIHVRGDQKGGLMIPHGFWKEGEKAHLGFCHEQPVYFWHSEFFVIKRLLKKPTKSLI